MGFDGFISYSHATDGRLAPCVQRGLHLMARPWHRRRALWIFRDQTGLSVTPALWSSIQDALDDSEYFVLLVTGSGTTVNLWDITDVTRANRLATIAAPVNSVALSSDDKTLVAVVDRDLAL